MITKSAREIIRNAKTLANADNSSFTDFYTNTTILNNAYRDLYDELVNNSEAFVKTIETTGSCVLPDDCYAIVSVTDRAGNPVQQAPISGHVFGYWVENGVFTVPKHSTQVYKITYATIPATITAPDEWIQIPKVTSGVSRGGQYYCRYDPETQSFYRKEKTPAEYATYCGQPLELTYAYKTSAGGYAWTVTVNGVDVTDRFSREGHTIVNIQVHDPYMAVSYNDGVVMIYTGFQGAEWNYRCIEGHPTRGEVLALWTDDVTGFGMLFRETTNSGVDTSYDWYAPFVPDTILSYPNNTLFAVLEYRVASVFAGLLNMNTEFIDKKLAEAETNFFKNLGSTANARRIKNGHRAKGLFWGY